MNHNKNLWLLIPIITAVIVLATVIFLFTQPRVEGPDFTMNSPKVSEDTIHYQDYLGTWVHGKTEYEELLREKGGSLVEIQEISDQVIKGTFTKVTKTLKNPRTFNFNGMIKKNKAEIEYTDGSGTKQKGTISLKDGKIGVLLHNDSNFKKWDKERLFVRAKVQVKTASLQEVLGYLDLSRDEVVKKLGTEFKVFPSGRQGTEDGYFYPKYDLVIVFENGKTKDRVAYIDCKEAVDINGVKAGSSFDEVRAKLGNAPLIETWDGTPDHKVFRLVYYVTHGKILFQSDTKDGSYSKVYILRK